MLEPVLTSQGLQAHGQIFERLAVMIDGGLITSPLDRQIFTLSKLNEAHKHIRIRQAIGNIVINV